ncbi:MAG TPA: DUF4397 domain-containing protein [Egibacteraceae bacterium]|nr:DUF4397 domain-containing protein [Egibacteraceae bacterium]
MSINASHAARRSPPRMILMALSAAVLVLAVAGPAAAQTDQGTVTVVHGVPDLVVDVYVNGDLTLEDFAPGTITDPLTLPAGDYELAIRPAGADASSDPAIAGSATLPAGADASIVAHLDADGAPTLSVFSDDTSEIGAGEARLTVRHTAAAPTVDILADGSALVSGLANPDEAAAEVPAATYQVAVALEGTADAVIGPADLALEEGTAYFVYAIGSAEDASLDLLVQTIGGLHSAPSGVPAGTGGLLSDAMPMWLVALTLVAAASAAAAGTQLVRVRARK